MRSSFNEGYEARLADSLADLDQAFSKNTRNPVKPHEVWAEEGVFGVLDDRFRNTVVHLSNSDFRHGTLRILVPCKLVLCESIVFNPNSGISTDPLLIDRERDESHDWFPHRDQAAYDPHFVAEGVHGAAASPAFRLGFFAAITIEHPGGAIIDLNGFRLSCHPDFAMQQRFHALIELANQPFLPGQGPADFGSYLRAARNVWIRNGELGRSSHHGIHGNGMQDVLISGVTFRDYEVAAISLNGGRRIVIRDCQLEGTFTQVPILGTYSAGRFARLIGGARLGFARQQLASADLSKAKKKRLEKKAEILEAAIQELGAALDDAFDAVKRGELDSIVPLFRNPAYVVPGTGETLRLADANPYGIAIHARGVLVNAFLCNGSKLGAIDDFAKAFECTDVTIERVNIARTRGNVREVVALAEKAEDSRQASLVADAAGAVFRFFAFDSQLSSHGDLQPGEMTSDGYPDLTVLGRVQICIAAIEKELVELGLLEKSRMLTGGLQPILSWASEDGSRFVQSRSKYEWKLKLDGEDDREFVMRSNGDTMHHVNKGGLGLFIQAVDGLRVNRVIVAGLENAGLPGSNKAGPYQGSADGGHGAQDQQVGYSGADARGIYIGACSNVCADRIQAHGVVSRFGHATGIEFAGGTEHAEIHSAVVGNVVAGAAFHGENSEKPFVERLPNAFPVAVGLSVDRTTRNVGVEDFQVTGQISQPGKQVAAKIRVEARLNHMTPGHDSQAG